MQVAMDYIILTLLLKKLLYVNPIITLLPFQVLGIKILAKFILNKFPVHLVWLKGVFHNT